MDLIGFVDPVRLKDFSFLTLEKCADAIAGFHTGQELILSDDYLESRVTYNHELMHGRVFRETSDGQLHLLILLAIESECYKDDRAQLKIINKYLFESTREAHERLATYLGIQSLSTNQDMLSAKEILPKGYLEYYSFLDEKFSHIDSSYLRFLLAWGAGRLAFNSIRIAEFSDLHVRDPSEMAEGPSERLNRIGSFVSEFGKKKLNSIIEAIGQQIYQDIGLDRFSMWNERDWLNAFDDRRAQLQMFEGKFLLAWQKYLSDAAEVEEYRDQPIPKYFINIADRIDVRSEPLQISETGSTPSYKAALELAAEGDSTRIERSALLSGKHFEEKIAETWLRNSANIPLSVSAVEIPGQRGVYKLFVSSRRTDRGEYANFAPTFVSGDEFSVFLRLLLNTGRAEKGLIPPIFLFSDPLNGGVEAHKESFCDISCPDAEVAYWRAGMSMGESGKVRLFPFYFFYRWSHLISNSTGEHLTFHATFSVPEENSNREVAICLLSPRDRDWIPSVRLMSKRAFSLYRPLLSRPEISSRLSQVKPIENDGLIAGASYSLWESLRFL